MHLKAHKMVACAVLVAWAGAGCVSSSPVPAGGGDGSGSDAPSVDGGGGSADGGGSTADGGGGDSAKTDATSPQPAAPVVDLVVDANRDGVPNPDDKEDQDFEEVFDAKHGAAMLANLDDDDSNKVEDFYDTDINGPNDALDLAPVVLRAWPGAPDGASAKLTVTNPDQVRVWTKLADGSWGLVAGAFDVCDTPDTCNPQGEATLGADLLRSGLALYVEARDFRRSQEADKWDGEIVISLAVTADGKAVEAAGAPGGVDTVRLRVAPWLLNGNLSEFDKWRSLKWPGSSNATAFNIDLIKIDEELLAAEYEMYTWYGDQWTQDWFQTGITQIPAPNGKVQGMRVYNARPYKNGGKDLPFTVMRQNMLGPDRAIYASYKKPNTGTTYDSHGNHDLLPPYENGADKYPYGRIITGSGVLPETWAWYDAQKIQGPTLKVVTNWLAVGHVDEILSYAPAKTARGWKLLVADDEMAKVMFEKLLADGHGEVEVFAGKTVEKGGTPVKGKITVKSVLEDQDILQASQTAHVKTEAAVDIVRKAVGLKDDELVPMPFLTEDFGGGKMIAWQPGTVNSQIVYDTIMVPNPFGPKVGGVDVWAKDLQDRLGSDALQLGSDGKGLKVRLVDDWYGYHLLMGEVHCGTNPEMPPSPKIKWWTVEH